MGDIESTPELGRSPGEGNGNPPTPVFSPGEVHGQRSLEGYSPGGRKESDTTEQLNNKKHSGSLEMRAPSTLETSFIYCDLSTGFCLLCLCDALQGQLASLHRWLMLTITSG